MSIPNISNLVVYTDTPLDDGDWLANWTQDVNWLTDGTADLTINSLTTNAGVNVKGNVTFSGTNSTGSGSAALGANCPAITATAPYTWIKVIAKDGTTVYIPAWE